MSSEASSKGRKGPLVLGALVLLIVIGVLAAKLLPLDEWTGALSDWGQEAGPSGALLVGLLFIPICVFMLPATALTYAMAFAFGLWPSVLGVWAGALLGAASVFLLGRTFARDLVSRSAESHPLLGALDKVLDERSFGMLVLIRLSPLFPFALVGYALGASRAGFWRHLAATGIAILPQVTVTCWIGASVAEATGGHEKGPLEYTLLVVGIAAALVVLAVISKRTRAALQGQLEAVESSENTFQPRKPA
jgi:uncharacterized membrane protein YdjX (TVP38/TMEM64 family)